MILIDYLYEYYYKFVPYSRNAGLLFMSMGLLGLFLDAFIQFQLNIDVLALFLVLGGISYFGIAQKEGLA